MGAGLSGVVMALAWVVASGRRGWSGEGSARHLVGAGLTSDGMSRGKGWWAVVGGGKSSGMARTGGRRAGP